MAKTYNKLNIEINQKVTDIITAVQDDTNSRYLDVQLFDNGTPINLTGQEVRIFLKKPDGTNIWNDGEVTSATEGRCQFLLTTQTLAVCGVLETQISIWQNNEEILSTEIFKIFVTKSLRSSGSIESSNEYGSLVVLFQNIYEALDLMTEMVQSFGTAGAVAQGIPVTTFWQMLEAVYTVNAEALANASVSEVLDRIGLTTDTGGSTTAGTLMAKTNRLISDVLELKEVPYMVSGLQEYTTYTLNSIKSGLSGSWFTLVDVSGEGFLSGFLTEGGIANQTPTFTTGLKITIDNNLIFSQPTAHASNMGYIGLLNINYVCSSDRVAFGDLFLSDEYLNFFNWSKINYSNTEEYVVSSRELPFKQNLKIEIYCDTNEALTYFGMYHIKNT